MMRDRIFIKNKLVNQAVLRLKRFGFVHVSKTNIMTDEVYMLYFEKILREMTGKARATDRVIHQLLEQLNSSKNKNRKSDR
jgi:hypothetical protein